MSLMEEEVPEVLQALRSAVDSFISQLQCAICLQPYDSPTSLPCHHSFCLECIHRSLELKPQCPICKTRAVKRKLRFDHKLDSLQKSAAILTSSGGPASSTKETSEDAFATHQRTPAKAKRKRRIVKEKPPPKKKKEVEQKEETRTKKTKPVESVDYSNHPIRFERGQLVEVDERRWAGMNKPGGTAFVTEVHADGTYNIKFVVAGGRESHVPPVYIHDPPSALVAQDAPSQVVRQRHRSHSDASQREVVEEAKTVVLCSGLRDDMMLKVRSDVTTLDNVVVVHEFSDKVTHLIASCEGDGLWAKVRSMKYLKALAGGLWIVSPEWLHQSALSLKLVDEEKYEVEGYAKGKDISEAPKRARQRCRETGGTDLFSDLTFVMSGDFFPPMPSQTDVKQLLELGGGTVLEEDEQAEDADTTLVVVSDKLGSIDLKNFAVELEKERRQETWGVDHVAVVNYQWVLNSVSQMHRQPLQLYLD